MIVSTGKATLHELDTVYSTEDLYDLIEIVVVDAQNEKLLSQRDED
jgi:4-diphosphocytidyl-2C-methyl-D-erythritol kinase